jgi:hypothetical protein
MSQEELKIYLSTADQQLISEQSGVTYQTVNRYVFNKVSYSKCAGLCIALASERKKEAEAKAKQITDNNKCHV